MTQESETNGLTVNYTYDAAGNRSQMAVTGSETHTTAYTSIPTTPTTGC